MRTEQNGSSGKQSCSGDQTKLQVRPDGNDDECCTQRTANVDSPKYEKWRMGAGSTLLVAKSGELSLEHGTWEHGSWFHLTCSRIW